MNPVPMVGRADELREIVGGWVRVAQADISGTSAVVITGSAGMGKSRLVGAALDALDPASLNLVGELAAAPRFPALLVVTSQPPEMAVSRQLVARTLARLSGAPGAIRQHLGPLSQTQVAEILTHAHPGISNVERLSRNVWERTAGNPYWLSELLAASAGLGIQALDGDAPADPAGPAVQPGDGEVELTARELQVLECLAAGMSNKQVAKSLEISIRTVAVHVSNLLRKTGLSSRTEAALWAVRRA